MNSLDYIPSVHDLMWLISESPRGNSVWNHFYQGQATARELAKVIWSNIDINSPQKFSDKTMTPVAWVASILNEEMFSRRSCNLKKQGQDYLVLDSIRVDRESSFDRVPNFGSGKSKPRPLGLPFWGSMN